VIRTVRGLRRWSLAAIALASIAAGLAASWFVLDGAVLGRVPTGELLAVIAIAVLPVLTLVFLRWAPTQARRDEHPDAPTSNHAGAEARADERPRRAGAWGRSERDSRPRTHAGSTGRESVRR